MIDALLIGLSVLGIKKTFGIKSPAVLIGLALGIGAGQALARRRPVKEGVASGMLAMAAYDAGQTFVGETLRRNFGPGTVGAKFFPIGCLNG